MESNVKLLGHPLHPMLIVFPLGLLATSVIFSGVSVGTVAGVPAGALVGELIGWRWSFAAASVMALIVLGGLAAWLPSIKAEPSNGLKQIPALLKMRTAQIGLLAVAHGMAAVRTAVILPQAGGQASPSPPSPGRLRDAWALGGSLPPTASRARERHATRVAWRRRRHR